MLCQDNFQSRKRPGVENTFVQPHCWRCPSGLFSRHGDGANHVEALTKQFHPPERRGKACQAVKDREVTKKPKKKLAALKIDGLT